MLFDLRSALQFRMADTAVVSVGGVHAFEWQREPTSPSSSSGPWLGCQTLRQTSLKIRGPRWIVACRTGSRTSNLNGRRSSLQPAVDRRPVGRTTAMSPASSLRRGRWRQHPIPSGRRSGDQAPASDAFHRTLPRPPPWGLVGADHRRSSRTSRSASIAFGQRERTGEVSVGIGRVAKIVSPGHQ